MLTSRQEQAAKKKYRKSVKGRETQRLYSRKYYHSVLKFDEKEIQKRRHRNRMNHYLENYGITPEEADRLKSKGCDLCGNTSGKMNIDHKHGEKGFRGVLCNPCNLMVGWIELAQDRMPKILEYMARGNTNAME